MIQMYCNILVLHEFTVHDNTLQYRQSDSVCSNLVDSSERVTLQLWSSFLIVTGAKIATIDSGSTTQVLLVPKHL